MQLSKRLAAVAALVSPGNRVADVGTDHGYIPIYLVKSGISPNAVAMDIRPGPLQRAREHIHKYGMDNKIDTRLSDGVAALNKGEAETLVIAGMGGNVMIHILEEGREVIASIKECILQPQSDITKFRQYLYENGFITVAEDFVEEDGKYYPMMKVIPDSSTTYTKEKTEKEILNSKDRAIDYQFGRLLIQQNHPVLREYLINKMKKNDLVMQNISDKAETGRVRLVKLQEQRQQIMEALELMGK